MRKTALILVVTFDLGVMAVAAQAQQQTREPPRIPTTSTGPTFPGPQQSAVAPGVPACAARRGAVVWREGVQQCRLPAVQAAQDPLAPVGGLVPAIAGRVQDPTGPGGDGGCTPGLPMIPGRPTRPCTGGPAAISDQAAAGNLTSFLPTAQPDGPSTGGVSPRNGPGPRSGVAVWDPTGANGGCTPGGASGPCTGGPAGPGPVFLRLDRVNTVQACVARQGEVVRHEGVRQCRLPSPARLEDANSALQEASTTR